MASLLERIDISPSATGPVRRKSDKGQRSSPYTRPGRVPKGDVDAAWTHDLYESNSLSSRIDTKPNPPRVNLNSLTQKAIREATGASQQLSIKGASATSQGNVVEVTGLVSGTTAEDVAAIFKRCGEITNARLVSGGSEPRIRLTFKRPASATASVAKFNNQPADGKTLSVTIVGATTAGTTLTSRIDADNGLGLVREEGTVDILMDSEDTGSKMRSDTLLRAGTDPRAQVLVAPPGADPADYVRAPKNSTPDGTRRGGARGGRRGGGARRGGGRRGGLESRMDTD